MERRWLDLQTVANQKSAMIQFGKTHITKNREDGRIRDREQLERGEVTAEELQERNSLIPMELANDPAWKAAGLRAAVESMTRAGTRLEIPESLLNKNRHRREKHKPEA